MIWNDRIEGKYVRLRSISEEDCEFSVSIRQDPVKTRFLHKVDNNTEKQLNWIREQQRKKGDYFFIVEQLDGKKIGTIGIYAIEGTVGEIGRLLMFGNAVQTYETELLAMKFAYETLKLEKLLANVYAENKSSLRLSDVFGFHFDTSTDQLIQNCSMMRGESYSIEFPQYAQKVETLIYR